MKRDITERIDTSLIQSQTIKSWASGVQKIMNALFNSPLRPLKNFLNGTWLEHPLHPLLTDVPVGAWTVALLLDLVALVLNVRGLGLPSGITIGLGVLAALAAIATGLADWMDVDPPELAIGITHAIINTAATILFAVSFFILWGESWTITFADFIPALIGYLLVSVGAFIGGSLVYRLGVMVNRNAYRTGPEEFVPVLPMQELPDNKPVRVEAKGRPVLLVRRGEEVYAIGAVCSHYGAPLEEGQLTDGMIQCPWHGSCFALKDGSVRAGPATAPIPIYRVRINKNQIEVMAASD
jgi:nitrite reductase/ring-hydroxylating ferredoxin subunit/uncharacterized membrane protein